MPSAKPGYLRPQVEYFVRESIPSERLARMRRHVGEKGGKLERIHLRPVSKTLDPKARMHLRITGLSGEDELEIRREHKLRVLPPYRRISTPPGIEIKPATLRNLDELHELEKLCFEDPALRSEREEFERRIKTCEVFKAVDKKTGRIVGAFFSSSKRFEEFRRLYENPVPTTKKPPLFSEHHFFIDLIVHPEFRKRGVGSALMQKGMEIARKANKTKVFFVAVSPENFPWFEELGYVLHEPTFDPKKKKRIYWAPVAIGRTERYNKLWYEGLNSTLQKFVEAVPSCTENGEIEVRHEETWKKMIDGVSQSRLAPLGIKMSQKKRIEVITRILIPEVLTRLHRRRASPDQPKLLDHGMAYNPYRDRLSSARKLVNTVRNYFGYTPMSRGTVEEKFGELVGRQPKQTV